MPEARLILIVDQPDGKEQAQTVLEATFPPGEAYKAVNILMESMRNRIKQARHVELSVEEPARPKSDQEVSRARHNVRQR